MRVNVLRSDGIIQHYHVSRETLADRYERVIIDGRPVWVPWEELEEEIPEELEEAIEEEIEAHRWLVKAYYSRRYADRPRTRIEFEGIVDAETGEEAWDEFVRRIGSIDDPNVQDAFRQVNRAGEESTTAIDDGRVIMRVMDFRGAREYSYTVIE